MSAIQMRWARPKLRSEGCSDGPSRSSSQAGRDGEVRFFGEVDASQGSKRRVVQRNASRFDDVHFCYEAGPTGYGPCRLIRSPTSKTALSTVAGYDR
jgi:hypothetical protein